MKKWLFAFVLTALTAGVSLAQSQEVGSPVVTPRQSDEVDVPADSFDRDYDLRYLDHHDVRMFSFSQGGFRIPGGVHSVESIQAHLVHIMNDVTVFQLRFVRANCAGRANNRDGRVLAHLWREAGERVIRNSRGPVTLDEARRHGGIVQMRVVVEENGGIPHYLPEGADKYLGEYVQIGGMSAANRTIYFGPVTLCKGVYRVWMVVVPFDGPGILDCYTFLVWETCGNVSPVSGISRIREVKVPGPERVVEKRVEVPGPERRIEVPGPERVVEKRVEVPVPGPERVVERVVYRDRVTCQAQVQLAPTVLLAPPGQRVGEQTRSNWSMPTTQVLATGYVALVPSPKPCTQQTSTGCAPGGAPNPTTLPPGPTANPGASTATEPNPPGAPPVTGPGSGGEVGTNTPQPSTPNPGNSTVPAKPPAGSAPDTSGLKSKAKK